MGNDRTELKGIKEEGDDITPSSSSRSGDEEIRIEKQETWDSRRDTTLTAKDSDALDFGIPAKKSHTHTLGILKFRADDDEDPADWWFASTAVPLIAATFAPMANLLSIAALVVYWRNKLVNSPDSTTETADDLSEGIKDPHWCTALNVASLVCGFVGNLFLLFNFTKRVRYIVALPATIILFYFASGILIAITASMALHDAPREGEVYSQGFWHAIIAACLYLFNAMILMVNMWGYFLGHYPQHFTLTDEQRNLILQTMMFFMWLGGGAAVFAHIEQWSYPDALYFCDVTILTIGFGDFFPTDNLGRGLVFPFSVGGIIILGLMVSSISKFAGELSKDNVLRKHVETRRVNTLSRAVTRTEEETRRDELEKKFAADPNFRPSISSPILSPTEKPLAEKTIAFGEDPEKGEQEDPSPNQFLGSKLKTGAMRNTWKMIAAPVMQLQKVRTRNQKQILMREEKDRFDAMRNIQVGARKFKKWYALGISLTAFSVLWCVGAVVFWQAEKDTQGMTYFKALYFCYVSLLTIGYGDLSPRSNAGKPFFIVWSLIAVPTMTILISDMGDTVISAFKQGTFKIADFTVLPKHGLYAEIMRTNPWLWNWLKRRNEQKRIAKGFQVDANPMPPRTIEQLALEELSETELTKQLAFAIRRTADDLKRHATTRYSYEEWVEFIRLIRFTKTDIQKMEHDEEKEGIVEWDWLAENSPMLSEQSEAEWVLDRLCESLLRLLRKNRLAEAAGIDTVHESENSFPMGFVPFSFTRPKKGRFADSEEDPLGVAPPAASKPEPPVNKSQEKRQRATGADAMLTFFTGERRGANAYATNEPLWSKKAQERMTERRRSSVGARKGPFSKLVHAGATGAVGGGRGGAGTRTLKARAMYGSIDREMM